MVEYHLAKVVVEGSIPFSRSIFCGGVAQLVEQLTLNQWVHGSNPCTPTILEGVLFSFERNAFFVSGLTFWPVSRNISALFENKRVGLTPALFCC